MRRAARRDDNELVIIKRLRSEGVVVQQLNDPGVPDLLCYTYRGIVLLETKSRKGKLTAKQEAFWKVWGPREGIDLFVVRNELEALVAVGLTP